MGIRLHQFYSQAEESFGLLARARLARYTHITSAQAMSAPDSPENLRRFTEAMTRIASELGTGPGPSLAGQALRQRSGIDTAEALRRYLRTLVDLMGQRALFLDDVAAAGARVTEAAAQALDCARVSVWRYDAARTRIRCATLFERHIPRHSSGMELSAQAFPRYFKAIERERTLAAHDACGDPRTSEFAEAYLRPLGITSMLDVPIWVGDTMIGVLCHEHVGPMRTWTSDDESFAFLMADVLSLALERR